MNEDTLQSRIAKFLSRWFKVEREVESIDNKSRIDIVIIHHTDVEQKYPIGIEVKLAEKKRGMDLAKWLKQAIRYTRSKFKGYGKVMVITAPQITGYYLNEGINMHQHDPFGESTLSLGNNVHTFIGGFDIGELQKYERVDYKTNATKKYFRIVYKSSLIWDSRTDDFRTNNIERLWQAE